MIIQKFLGLQGTHARTRTKSDEAQTSASLNNRWLRAIVSPLATQLVARTGMLLAIVIAGMLLALSPQTASAQGKTIMILAPHGSDEALCCAGAPPSNVATR